TDGTQSSTADRSRQVDAADLGWRRAVAGCEGCGVDHLMTGLDQSGNLSIADPSILGIVHDRDHENPESPTGCGVHGRHRRRRSSAAYRSITSPLGPSSITSP